MALDADPVPFRNILAPVDGSPHFEIAVRRSRALLSFPGCRLTLFHVGPADPRIDKLASEARRFGAETAVRCVAGPPEVEILREIEAGGHDLVLMTSRRRPALGRALPDPIAVRVLRRSPVPLMLYRPLSGLDESFLSTGRSEPAAFHRILLMLDGAADSDRLVESARRLAHAFRAELILFHAMAPGRFTPERMEGMRAYLASRAAEAGASGIWTRIQIVVGEPVKEALRMMDCEADTLALTTRGRSSWSAAVFGSTARRLLRFVEGPMLCLSSSIGPARTRAAGAGDLRSGRETAHAT